MRGLYWTLVAISAAGLLAFTALLATADTSKEVVWLSALLVVAALNLLVLLRHGPEFHALLAAEVLLLVGLGAIGVVSLSRERPEKSCAGVGLDGSSDETAEQAFARFLARSGREQKDWRRGDASQASVWFERRSDSDPERLASIHVGLQPDGSWMADGACVDSPRRS
jgi:hypothetical protein